MLSAKSCERCNGNMMLEEYLREFEFVCLQCGHRLGAPQFGKPAYGVGHAKKAA